MTTRIINFSRKYLLLMIILLAAFLRLWKLGSIPPHLTPDEAALGYNAFSILKTGRDEFGNFLPIIFQSFGDYKPGLYIYASVPFVALFGLSEWVIRLPSTLSGILSVYLIYLIVKNLTELTSFKAENQKLAIASAFVASVNPWLIYFSRGAWEVNFSLTLTLLGLYFFLRALKSGKFITHSMIFFALTLLTYQGSKLSTLIVVVSLAFAFRRNLKPFLSGISGSRLILSFLFSLLIVSPIIISFFNGQTGRLQVFSLFSYRRPAELVSSILAEGGEKTSSLSYYIFHSEKLYQKGTFLNHYFNHFSGKFLFFEGDWQNKRHTAPNSGVMLIIDLLFIPLGLYFLLKRDSGNLRNFILLWLILSPLPAVLSRDQVHAVRALNMAVPITMVSAFGLYELFSLFANFRFKNMIFTLFVSGYVLSLTYFLDSYFVHMPIHQANDWYYGYREAARKTEELRKDHNILFIQSYAQPYIYFMFYRAVDDPKNFDPQDFQGILKSNFEGGSIDVGVVKQLDNITFAGFSWPAPAKSGDIVVGTPIDIPDFYANDRFKLITEIVQPNGNMAFRIVEKL